MKATQKLHDIGQSLWLDNITRELLTSGTLRGYRDEFAVSGLTSNPTIFDHALRHGTDYDTELRQKAKESRSAEELFLALALTDLRQAADLFPAKPRPDQRGGRLGVAGTVAPAGLRHGQVDRGGQAAAREGGTAQLLHQ